MSSASESNSLPPITFPSSSTSSPAGYELALELGQCLTQQKEARAVGRPLCPSQFVGGGRLAVMLGQIQLTLLQHVDAECPTLLQQPGCSRSAARGQRILASPRRR